MRLRTTFGIGGRWTFYIIAYRLGFLRVAEMQDYRDGTWTWHFVRTSREMRAKMAERHNRPISWPRYIWRWVLRWGWKTSTRAPWFCYRRIAPARQWGIRRVTWMFCDDVRDRHARAVQVSLGGRYLMVRYGWQPRRTSEQKPT